MHEPGAKNKNGVRQAFPEERLRSDDPTRNATRRQSTKVQRSSGGDPIQTKGLGRAPGDLEWVAGTPAARVEEGAFELELVLSTDLKATEKS